MAAPSVKRTILLELGINKNQFLQEAVDTQKQITELNKRQKELKAAGQEASIEYQNNVANLKLLKTEYAEAQKAATNFERAIQEGTEESFGSLTQLQAELAVLNQEYKTLSETGREFSEEGIAIANATEAVTQKISEQEQRVGNFRRNVGNYPKQIVELTQRIKELNISAQNVDMNSKEFIEFGAQIKKSEEELQALIKTSAESATNINDLKNTIDALKTARLDAPLEQVGELNDAILDLETALQRAMGRIDEFGDREPKNAIKKSMDDLNDAVQGTIAAYSVAILLGADEEKAQEAMAKVTAINTIALNAQAIAKAAVVYWDKAQLVATKANIGIQAAYALVVGQSTGALKLFRIALASTGIGAILVLIGLLIANFTDVKKKVTDFIDSNQVLKAVLATVIAPLMLLWEGLKKVAEVLGLVASEQEKARDAVIKSTDDQVSAIERWHDREIALYRAAGEEVYKQERRKLRAVLERVNKSIEALKEKARVEGSLGEDELKQLQELEEKKLDLRNAVAVSNIEEQKKRADEAKKADEEAKKKADDAAKKLKDEQKKRSEEIRAFNKELSGLEFELNKQKLSAQSQELADLDRKYKDMQAKAKGNRDQIAKIEQLKQMELEQVMQKHRNEDLEKQREYEAQKSDLTLQRLNQQLTAASGNYNREYVIRLELLKQQMDAELKNTELTETQKQAIRENYQFQELQALKTLNEAKRAQELADAQKQAELDANDPTKSLDEKFNSRQLALDIERQQEIDAAIAKGEAIDLIERDFAQRSLQLQRDKDTAESEIRQAYIASLSETTDAMGELFGKQSSLYRTAFRARQVATIADIAINTKKEISGYFAGYSSLPFIGQALAIAKAAFAGIRGATAIAQVKAQNFATGGVYWSNNTGGMVYGPGTSTSDSINARLSNGESVINARSTAMFRPVLSAMNVAGGGKAFSNISYTMPAFATGGVYDGGYSADYNTPALDAREIGEVVGDSLRRNFPNIWVNVQDVNDAQAQQANVDNRVDF